MGVGVAKQNPTALPDKRTATKVLGSETSGLRTKIWELGLGRPAELRNPPPSFAADSPGPPPYSHGTPERGRRGSGGGPEEVPPGGRAEAESPRGSLGRAPGSQAPPMHAGLPIRASFSPLPPEWTARSSRGGRKPRTKTNATLMSPETD